MIKHALKKSFVFVVEGLYYHPRARIAVGVVLLLLAYPASYYFDKWWIGLITP